MTRVVKMLENMKKEVEADGKEDEEIYGKMECWCETNSKEKKEAIEAAKKRLEALAASIEEGEARSAQLGTEIDTLKEGIQADQDSLSEATALYEKDKTNFEQTEKEYMEASSTLKEAIEVLSKVQNPGGGDQALAQVRRLVSRISASADGAAGAGRPFNEVIRKDLWDFVGSLPNEEDAQARTSPRLVTGLEQQPLEGNAAGAKSYSAGSSRIFGLLSQMKSNFDKNLAESQKEHILAEISFQHLRSAKEGEIASASRNLEAKRAALAETNQAVAQAKEDTESTSAALEADQKFLVDLEERCKVAQSDYDIRAKSRGDEAVAISEAIAILMSDDARDSFSKTVSLLQLGSRQAAQGYPALLQSRLQGQQLSRATVFSKLMELARRRSGTDSGLRLASLAMGAQVSGIEKVKKLMADMIQHLKKQQKEEYEKKETCMQDIGANEDATRAKKTEEKDLQAKFNGLEGRMKELDEELAELNVEISQAHVSLQAASKGRKAENLEFQQVVKENRVAAQVLKKAEARLQAFYAESLLESGEHTVQLQGHGQAPPPAGKEYTKSSGGEGVLQILAKIIQDVQTADREAVKAEQDAQETYSEMVANTNTMLKATQSEVNKKTAKRAKAESDMLVTKKDLATTAAAIMEYDRQNHDLHLNCDYLLKNFVARQTGRQEEIEAIQEAISILSGADFGSA